MSIAADHVDIVFQCLLGRHPESEATVRAFQAMPDLATVIHTVRGSAEALGQAPPPRPAADKSLPFWHYNALIEPLGIIRSHAKVGLQPIPGRLINFLGVIIDPAIYPPLLAGRGGEVESIPIPCNWHADIAEFGAALRAVDLARGTFRMLELGCGWGCWLLNTGVAARSRGLAVDLIGAEGDEGHVRFAQAGCAENGFSSEQARILHGIVGPRPGHALFPKQDVPGASWGLMPIFDATAQQVEEAKAANSHDVLPTLTLGSLVNGGGKIDLVHLDIQGGEVDFIESCIDDLDRLVAYVVIGTHSRAIEGQIIGVMLAHGWVLEIERPAIFDLAATGLITTQCDGVQGWRNPRLTKT